MLQNQLKWYLSASYLERFVSLRLRNASLMQSRGNHRCRQRMKQSHENLRKRACKNSCIRNSREIFSCVQALNPFSNTYVAVETSLHTSRMTSTSFGSPLTQNKSIYQDAGTSINHCNSFCEQNRLTMSPAFSINQCNNRMISLGALAACFFADSGSQFPAVRMGPGSRHSVGMSFAKHVGSWRKDKCECLRL